MQIIQAYFNISCLSHGCWVIDIAFSKSSPNAGIALYIPRAQSQGAGIYTDAFNQTFSPNKFPCSTSNLSSKSATACCLPDFVSQYHVVSSFSPSLSCDPTSPGSFSEPDSVYGHFSDLPVSTVTELPSTTSQSSIVSRARLLLDNNELRSEASIFSGTVGVEERLDLFIGLAQFIPTNSRILDSSVSQVRLFLTKSDQFTVSAYGNNAYTFLSYINVRINEVLDLTNPSQRSQYAAVSFVLNDLYSPNPVTDLIPAASILIGYGASSQQASWTQACEQPVSAQYASRLSQTCGPTVMMCGSNPTVDLADRFVTINVPLQSQNGQPLFDLNNAATLENVLVSLVVSVIDSSGKPVSTKLTTSVAVVQGGVGTWCDAASAATTLEDVVETVDLLVGTAGSSQDFGRLQRVTGIQQTGSAGAHNVTQSLGSRSIESGLLTLAMKGKDEYFDQAGTAGFSLQLEDVVTLHIMGDSKLAAVTALLGSQTSSAFQVVADKVNRRSSLVPSAALSALCGASANPYPQASCVLRYDVRTRVSSATSYEIGGGSPAAAAAFMQGLAGKSDYVAGLGTNFSSLISQQYALNSTRRYRRAFWINPGFTWTGAGVAGADRFTLSQWLVMVALIDLDENSTVAGSLSGRRRRALLTATTGTAGSGAPSATVQYGIDPASLLALNLGLPLNHTSTWRVQLRLTAAQACMSKATLADALQNLIQQYMAAAATGLAQVGLVSVDVSIGTVSCRREGAAIRSITDFTSGTSDATALLYVIVAFYSWASPLIDLSKFSSMPGVLSIQVVLPAGVSATSMSGSANDGIIGAGDGGMSRTVVAAAAATAGAGFTIAAIAGILIWRARNSSSKAKQAATKAAAQASMTGEAECVVQCEMCFVGADEWKGQFGPGDGLGTGAWMVEEPDSVWPVYNGGGPAPRWITMDQD